MLGRSEMGEMEGLVLEVGYQLVGKWGKGGRGLLGSETKGLLTKGREGADMEGQL